MIRLINKTDYVDYYELGKELNDNFNKLFNLDDILLKDYNKIYVFIDKSKVVGFIHIQVSFDEADIINIAVDKNYRCQHIGSELISYVITDNNLKCLNLEVRTKNPAVKFYEKEGFKIIRTISNYYDNDNAYFMKKVISMIKILAIESSCDETSAAIIEDGHKVLSLTIATQMDTHAEFGGVVPEIASRMHTEAIDYVIEDCLRKANLNATELNAIAVTYAPGLLGSLLVGIEAAKSLSLAYNKPLIAVNHLAGHIYANNLENNMEFPLLALVVSGGHTQLIYMEKDYSFKVLGSTLDDAIGEAYDKVARVLGLKYPGGPNVEKMALNGTPDYHLPIPMNDDTLNLSFSGLKSAVINLVHNEHQKGKEINKENLACSFQTVAVDEICRKVDQALQHVNVKQLIIAGGVSANKYLRAEVTKIADKNHVNISVPKLIYCTDNAAMIGAAAYPLYIDQKFADYSLNAKSQEEL